VVRQGTRIQLSCEFINTTVFQRFLLQVVVGIVYYIFSSAVAPRSGMFNCPENKDSAGGVQEASDTYTTQGRCVYY
jgi:hypothetical protein